jgi:L-rhamnose mutarotase
MHNRKTVINMFPEIKPARMFRMLILMVLVASSCNLRDAGKKERMTLVMTTDLVDDPELIKLYEHLHSKDGVWPEIKKANVASGIEEIRIYRYGNRLTMMVDIPADTDLAKMDSLYLSADARIPEWGRFMSGFQRSLPGVDTTRKWVDMTLIHHYRDGEYLK